MIQDNEDRAEAEIGELMQSYPNSHSGHFSHTTLRSPVDGIVVKREVVVGEAVDFESELFTIVDISHVWVQANIAETEKLISYPIEIAMSGLPKVREIRSLSKFGINASRRSP
jgi:multidrug resistance efflux pump